MGHACELGALKGLKRRSKRALSKRPLPLNCLPRRGDEGATLGFLLKRADIDLVDTNLGGRRGLFGAKCAFCLNTWLTNPSDPLVPVPTVRIDGGDPEMYVESGSSVVLRCHISNWLQKPQIVFWYDYQTITRFIWPSFLARWEKTCYVQICTQFVPKKR